MYTLTGTVKVINETQVISDKFKKREIVVTDASGNYPQDVLFQLTQERVEMADGIEVNDVVNISFFLRGREWTSPQGEVRYFNSLDIWKVEKNTGSAATPPDTKVSTPENAESFTPESDDDLPF